MTPSTAVLSVKVFDTTADVLFTATIGQGPRRAAANDRRES